MSAFASMASREINAIYVCHYKTSYLYYIALLYPVVEPSFQILELQRVYIEYDREPLNVLPPFPKTTTQYIPARLFNKLTMVCYSEGIPYPETTWYKDGQPMTSNEKVFEIQEVKQSDRGYYECVVNNTFKGEAKYQMTGRFLVNITG